MSEEEDTTIAFCAGCGSVIPDYLAEKDLFLQNGQTGVCPFCGGPVLITDLSQAENLRARRQNGEVL